jgi:PilZ domain
MPRWASAWETNQTSSCLGYTVVSILGNAPSSRPRHLRKSPKVIPPVFSPPYKRKGENLATGGDMQSEGSLLEHRPAQSLVSPGPANPGVATSRQVPRGPDKRERTRVSSKLPLTVKFGGIYESATEATNISARGMFFALQQRLEMGAAIELVFRLPRHVIGVDGIWLRCPAEVVRVQEGLPEGKFGFAAKIKSYEIFVG